MGHRRRRAGRQGREPRRAYGFVTTLPFSAAHAVVFTHCADHGRRRARAARAASTRLGGVPGSWSSTATPRSWRAAGAAAAAPGRRARRPARRPRHGPRRAAAALAAEQGRRGAHQRLPRDLASCRCAVRRTSPTCRARATPGRPRSPGRATCAASAAAVAEALAVERAELAALPDPLPDTDRRLEVRASRDGFVRVAGVDYSLPPGYAGRRVAGPALARTRLASSARAAAIARHARSYVPADVVRDAEHMARPGRRAGGPATACGAASPSCPPSTSPATTPSWGRRYERRARPPRSPSSPGR